MLDSDTALAAEPIGDDDGEDDIHAEAMRNFDEAVLPQLWVRELSLEARRFVAIPGAQWEGAWGDQFANSIKLEINKALRPVRKLESDYRQNRIVPDFRPSGGKSDPDTAETLDGLHRADSYEFKAQQARDNAASEAFRGGFGAYRLTNEWADPLDKDNDHQRINPGSVIPDADQSVFFGPSALYDKSDAPYAFVLTGLSHDQYKREYAGCPTSWPDPGIVRSFDWYRPDLIVVAEYYRVEQRDEWLLIFELEATGEEQRHWQKEIDQDAMDELKAKGWSMRKRKAKRQRCHKYILSGQEVLDDQGYVAGGNIPIVPVYGNRDFIDGVEYFSGTVQPLMDPSRLYNSSVSKLAETNALAPQERPIFLAEQMPPNLAKLWAEANIKRHPYALVNPAIDPQTGGIAAMGPIGKIDPPQISPVTAQLLEIANRDLIEDTQDSSGEVKANTSEDAMSLAAQRVDAKSGVYLDNVRQSIQREGELYLAMAREVYVEPGRVVETMTEDGDDGEATLHEDYLDGDTLKIRNDFATGKYKVIASVTEATVTRKDRTARTMLQVAEISTTAGDQEGAQAAIITATQNIDGEGLTEYQKWNRQRGLKLGLFEPNDDEKRQAQEDAAQAGQQPDPAQIALQVQVGEAQSKIKVNEATAAEKAASAHLKIAQAEAVGGPDQVPDTPTGLHPVANDTVDAISKIAGAKLKIAQADHLQHDMHHQTIKTGHEIEMERRAADREDRNAA